MSNYTHAIVVDYKFVGIRVTHCRSLEAALELFQISQDVNIDNDCRIAIFRVNAVGAFDYKPVFTNYVEG